MVRCTMRLCYSNCKSIPSCMPVAIYDTLNSLQDRLVHNTLLVFRRLQHISKFISCRFDKYMFEKLIDAFLYLLQKINYMIFVIKQGILKTRIMLIHFHLLVTSCACNLCLRSYFDKSFGLSVILLTAHTDVGLLCTFKL